MSVIIVVIQKQMKPVLFSLGPVQVFSYGALIALGVLTALQLMKRRAKDVGWTSAYVYDLVFIVLVSGFLGARIYYVIEHWASYRSAPLKFFALWEGGLIFYGGVAGSLIGLYLTARCNIQKWLTLLDFLLPYVALVHAFGRIGCFFNGCCYGKICSLPWAVTFPHLNHPVHPTQIYEAVLCFVLFTGLYRHFPKRLFAGEITGFYFLFYGMIRFMIEFWRADNPSWLFLTWNQWISALTITFAAVFLFSKNHNLNCEASKKNNSHDCS